MQAASQNRVTVAVKCCLRVAAVFSESAKCPHIAAHRKRTVKWVVHLTILFYPGDPFLVGNPQQIVKWNSLQSLRFLENKKYYFQLSHLTICCDLPTKNGNRGNKKIVKWDLHITISR